MVHQYKDWVIVLTDKKYQQLKDQLKAIEERLKITEKRVYLKEREEQYRPSDLDTSPDHPIPEKIMGRYYKMVETFDSLLSRYDDYLVLLELMEESGELELVSEIAEMESRLTDRMLEYEADQYKISSLTTSPRALKMISSIKIQRLDTKTIKSALKVLGIPPFKAFISYFTAWSGVTYTDGGGELMEFYQKDMAEIFYNSKDDCWLLDFGRHQYAQFTFYLRHDGAVIISNGPDTTVLAQSLAHFLESQAMEKHCIFKGYQCQYQSFFRQSKYDLAMRLVTKQALRLYLTDSVSNDYWWRYDNFYMHLGPVWGEQGQTFLIRVYSAEKEIEIITHLKALEGASL